VEKSILLFKQTDLLKQDKKSKLWRPDKKKLAKFIEEGSKKIGDK
jgi:hypothetical protein